MLLILIRSYPSLPEYARAVRAALSFGAQSILLSLIGIDFSMLHATAPS